MNLAVVDASVVVKWFIPEVSSEDAVRLRDSGTPLHAPDLVDLEVASTTWKKIRQGVLTRPEGDFVMAKLPLVSVVRYPAGPLIAAAFDLADRTGRTVYDCVYLALAVQLGGRVVTADEKFVNSLAPTPWAQHILLLRDVP